MNWAERLSILADMICGGFLVWFAYTDQGAWLAVYLAVLVTLSLVALSLARVTRRITKELDELKRAEMDMLRKENGRLRMQLYGFGEVLREP